MQYKLALSKNNRSENETETDPNIRDNEVVSDRKKTHNAIKSDRYMHLERLLLKNQCVYIWLEQVVSINS